MNLPNLKDNLDLVIIAALGVIFLCCVWGLYIFVNSKL